MSLWDAMWGISVFSAEEHVRARAWGEELKDDVNTCLIKRERRIGKIVLEKIGQIGEWRRRDWDDRRGDGGSMGQNGVGHVEGQGWAQAWTFAWFGWAWKIQRKGVVARAMGDLKSKL